MQTRGSGGYVKGAGQSRRCLQGGTLGFEDAIAKLDNVAEDSYKDSTLIMQLQLCSQKQC